MTRYILNHGFIDLVFPSLERVIIDHEPDEFLSREEGLKKLLTAQGSYISEIQGHLDEIKKEYAETKSEIKLRDEPFDFIEVLAEFLDTNGTPEEKRDAFKTMMKKMKEGWQ